MKRLFVLIAMALILIAGACKIDGQVTARTVVTKTLKRSATYYKYTGVAADTVGTEQDTLYFIALSNKNVPINCNARVTFVRTGTTDTYDVDLEGKIFSGDSYGKVVESATNTASKLLVQPETSMIDSTNTAATGPTGDAMPGSGHNFYRYWRVFVGNDGTCAATDKITITSVEFKFYER